MLTSWVIGDQVIHIQELVKVRREKDARTIHRLCRGAGSGWVERREEDSFSEEEVDIM
jgi:hypothetical protein